jgi:hypothetical protein
MQQCPESFSPVNNGCVYDCSQHSMFRLTTANGQSKCEYRYDPKLFVELTPQNGIPVTGAGGGTVLVPSLLELDTADPTRATRYRAELNRVDAGVQLILADLDRDQQKQDAFHALQAAEAIRDTDPIAYQMARNTYYTLTKGDGWIETEQKRLLASEVDPELERYRSDYLTAVQQKTGQQRTLDIVEAVKDRVLSLKDDFSYSTSMFSKQIDLLKSQLNIERRGREGSTVNQDLVTFYSWFDILLNLALIVAALYGALTLWTVVQKQWPSEQRAYSVAVSKP